MTLTAPLIVSIADYTPGTGGQGAETPKIFAFKAPFDNLPVLTITDLASRPEADPFRTLMSEPRTPGNVRRCGDLLCMDLMRNARIGRSLEQIVGNPQNRTPIYLRFHNAPVGNLPWEALWESNVSFLTLRDNWPIARLGSQSLDPGVEWDRWIEPSLRVLVILAAAPGALGTSRVDATGEWDAIWPFLDELGSRVRVRVLVCQSKLATEIEALRDPRIRCERLIGNDPRTIQTAVDDFAPNIVHFFCHGSADLGAQLELANLNDYDRNASEGSIRLAPVDVADIGMSPSVWLLTLNSCKGAYAGMGANSMAAYVAEQGVPVVVAMRENVRYDDAHIFAGSFYKHLLRRLGKDLPDETGASDGRQMVISETVWIDAISFSRTQLTGGRAPDEFPEWTLPVVYVQERALRLKARSRTGEAQVAAQAASAAQTVTPAVAGATPVASAPTTDTKATKLTSRLTKVRKLRGELKALDTPPALLAAFDAEIETIERERDELERDTLIEAINTLAGSAAISAEMLAQFQTALDVLNKKLGVG